MNPTQKSSIMNKIRGKTDAVVAPAAAAATPVRDTPDTRLRRNRLRTGVAARMLGARKL